MSTIVKGLYYAESHEWVKVEGDFGFVGITDYAQHALGNVVYVDLPEVDDDVTQGDEFGAVESVKAASDLISPVSGTVVEVNEKLNDKPQLMKRSANKNQGSCTTIFPIRMQTSKRCCNGSALVRWTNCLPRFRRV